MQIGEQLSHYRIVGRLGSGGMGVVYRAEDVRLGRPVAVKVLAQQLAGNAIARRRFEAEARAASALDHPNICSLYDIGETPDGGLFLALAYCEGETLQHSLERGPLEVPLAIAIAQQIARGLAEAHAKGIVHRDIKPANLMVRPDGLVKILDFGVARVERDAGLTGPADSIGSPAYMAPEQIQSARVGPPADVWALGVVLFQMITGRRPFDGEGIQGLFYAILHHSPPALDALRPGVHPQLSRSVARALAKDPEQRYSTAAAFADALRDVATTSDQHTRVIADAAAPRAAAPSFDESSLAVLPFSDLSPARDQDWFCEGLAEELINALSEVPGLRVASRASTLQFRDHEPRVIGEKLKVGVLLTGSVRKAANRVRITTQLVKVDDGRVLASSRYEHDLDDVFALQDAIAKSAVETVLSRMESTPVSPRVSRPTANMEAYDLYLKARFHRNRSSLPSLKAAIDHYERAIAKDPNFAAAYAGLAEVYNQLGFYMAGQTRELTDRAKTLCRRALDIDPDQAGARSVLAQIRATCDWDWEYAETELRQVIARHPQHVGARHTLAFYVLTPLGRLDEALAEIRQALVLDPVSAPLNTSLGFTLHFARRTEDALAQLRATIDLDAEQVLARVALAEALIDAGLPDQALKIAETMPREQSDPRPIMSWCLAALGRADEARTMLAEQAGEYPGGRQPALFVAVLNILLGEWELALDQIDLLVEQRAPWLVWLGVRPVFDPLRDHPRYQRILDRMGLPNVRPPAAIGI